MWTARRSLLALLVVAIAIGWVSARWQETAERPAGIPVPEAAQEVFGRPDRMPPRPEQERVLPGENLALLDATLARIFPDGRERLTPEQQSLAMLRHVASALELRVHNGNASAVLRDGHGLCCGMALAFRVLCRRAGIPARYVGAFNLRPQMASHAMTEVWYAGRWHLMDATYGLFFYDRPRYDGAGTVASWYDLVLDDTGWTAFRVVERPWQGEPPANAAVEVEPVPSGWLADVYGEPLVDLYRGYARNGFPVAYGRADEVSFPVVADLRDERRVSFGAPDGAAADVAELAVSGGGEVPHYLVGGRQPPFVHTWSLRVPPGRTRVTFGLTSVAERVPPLAFEPLRAAHVVDVRREGRRVVAELLLTDAEAIVQVRCPRGEFRVDAIEVRRR
jgi:hypothetical protein